MKENIIGNIIKITRVFIDSEGNKTERDLTPEEIEQWKTENMANAEVKDDNTAV